LNSGFFACNSLGHLLHLLLQLANLGIKLAHGLLVIVSKHFELLLSRFLFLSARFFDDIVQLDLPFFVTGS
jgi:hypothetical protein